MKDYIATWKRTFDYSSRATRKEYWMFVLYNILVILASCLVSVGVYATGIESLALIWDNFIQLGVGLLFPLAVTISSISLMVRRLHDINKSGLFILLGLIPFVGGIILLVFALLETKPETNQWGVPHGVDTLTEVAEG